MSHTYRLPLESTTMPCGEMNCALVPTPLIAPDTPLPANVVTTCVAITICLMVRVSATNKTVPVESTATFTGDENPALVPTASTAEALPEPASVVTVALAITIFLMQLFPESATYAFPRASHATPRASLNPAFDPTPFTNPPAAKPAKRVTALVAMTTLRIRFVP